MDEAPSSWRIPEKDFDGRGVTAVGTSASNEDDSLLVSPTFVGNGSEQKSREGRRKSDFLDVSILEDESLLVSPMQHIISFSARKRPSLSNNLREKMDEENDSVNAVETVTMHTQSTLLEQTDDLDVCNDANGFKNSREKRVSWQADPTENERTALNQFRDEIALYSEDSHIIEYPLRQLECAEETNGENEGNFNRTAFAESIIGTAGQNKLTPRKISTPKKKMLSPTLTVSDLRIESLLDTSLCPSLGLGSPGDESLGEQDTTTKSDGENSKDILEPYDDLIKKYDHSNLSDTFDEATDEKNEPDRDDLRNSTDILIKNTKNDGENVEISSESYGSHLKEYDQTNLHGTLNEDTVENIEPDEDKVNASTNLSTETVKSDGKNYEKKIESYDSLLKKYNHTVCSDTFDKAGDKIVNLDRDELKSVINISTESERSDGGNDEKIIGSYDGLLKKYDQAPAPVSIDVVASENNESSEDGCKSSTHISSESKRSGPLHVDHNGNSRTDEENIKYSAHISESFSDDMGLNICDRNDNSLINNVTASEQNIDVEKKNESSEHQKHRDATTTRKTFDRQGILDGAEKSLKESQKLQNTKKNELVSKKNQRMSEVTKYDLRKCQAVSHSDDHSSKRLDQEDKVESAHVYSSLLIKATLNELDRKSRPPSDNLASSPQNVNYKIPNEANLNITDDLTKEGKAQRNYLNTYESEGAAIQCLTSGSLVGKGSNRHNLHSNDYSTSYALSPSTSVDEIKKDTINFSRSPSEEIFAGFCLTPEPTKHKSFDEIHDISSATKKINATSIALVERLRGAAQRRKIVLNRSRQTHVEKEKLKVLANEQRKQSDNKSPFFARTQGEKEFLSKAIVYTEESPNPYKPFKARKIPASTHKIGNTGQTGLKKRPLTSPKSPLLGQRRNNQSLIRNKAKKALKNKSPKFKLHSRHSSIKTNKLKETISTQRANHRLASSRKIDFRACQTGNRKVDNCRHEMISSKCQKKSALPSGDNPYKSFKARPLPATTSEDFKAGTFGIPKVKKRPTTVATSPQLGIRTESRSHKTPLATNECTHSKVETTDLKAEKPKKISSSCAKESALRAKPFTRHTTGIEASETKETASKKTAKTEGSKNRIAANFKARILPHNKGPAYEMHSPLQGLFFIDKKESDKMLRSGEQSPDENCEPPHPNIQPGYLSMSKKLKLPPTLHSSKRAENRAEFESFREHQGTAKRIRDSAKRRRAMLETSKKLDKLRSEL